MLIVLLGVVGLVALALHFVWPRDHEEVQLRQSEKSPDGKWVGVVQLEVFNTAWVVNDAVYAVRLKGSVQKDRAGDLVMNVPVNYPVPAPSIGWLNGTLVVTLAEDQKYQFLDGNVDGVPVVVQRRAGTGVLHDSTVREHASRLSGAGD